jgi:amino acid transporter
MADTWVSDYYTKHLDDIIRSNDGSEVGDFSSIDPHSGVKRGLATRHVCLVLQLKLDSINLNNQLSMIALAGIIGPGLLVGSGGALASGGPASL